MAGNKPGPARRKPAGLNSRGRMAVPVDTRADAEALARWVEQLFASYAEQIAREQTWLQTHPEDKESRNRLAWLRNALSTSELIAYYLRTHRVRGPL